MAEGITMADFRKACEDRLDSAIESGEEGLQQRRLSGIEIVEFETPAGLELRRFGGILAVSCDFSDLDDDAEQRKVSVEFFKHEEVPEVIEMSWSDKGTTSKNIKQKDHDRLALELSKYITLIP